MEFPGYGAITENFLLILDDLRKPESQWDGMDTLYELMKERSPLYLKSAIENKVFDQVLNLLDQQSVDPNIKLKGIRVLADVLSESSDLAESICKDMKNITKIISLLDMEDHMIKYCALLSLSNIIADSPRLIDMETMLKIAGKANDMVSNPFLLPVVSVLILNICSTGIPEYHEMLVESIWDMLRESDPLVLTKALSALSFFNRSFAETRHLKTIVQRLVGILHSYKYDEFVAVSVLKALLALSEDYQIMNELLENKVLEECSFSCKLPSLVEKYLVILLSTVSLGTDKQVDHLYTHEVQRKLGYFLTSRQNLPIESTVIGIICRLIKRATPTQLVDMLKVYPNVQLVDYCLQEKLDAYIRYRALKVLDEILRNAKGNMQLGTSFKWLQNRKYYDKLVELHKAHKDNIVSKITESILENFIVYDGDSESVGG